MPRPVVLEAWNPQWTERAADRIDWLRGILPAGSFHHIGSTAVEGLSAKPIIDLLGIVEDLDRVEAARQRLESAGYAWRGENGIAGRRFLTLNGPANAERLVHLHVFADGHPAIERHLRFRDMLRSSREARQAYETAKLRCAALHPDDSGAYTDCKAAIIARIMDSEAEA